MGKNFSRCNSRHHASQCQTCKTQYHISHDLPCLDSIASDAIDSQPQGRLEGRLKRDRQEYARLAVIHPPGADGQVVLLTFQLANGEFVSPALTSDIAKQLGTYLLPVAGQQMRVPFYETPELGH